MVISNHTPFQAPAVDPALIEKLEARASQTVLDWLLTNAPDVARLAQAADFFGVYSREYAQHGKVSHDSNAAVSDEVGAAIASFIVLGASYG